ncbi:MAG: M48 family metallopeptidase [Opitutales bacterium]|nr:M48 family metallopeptidase [Opitutales bacterium]
MKLPARRAHGFFLSVLLGAALFSGCATGPQLLPESFLENMAVSQFAQMKQEMPVSQNPVHVEQVERIGARLAAAVAEEMPDMEWEFVVFDDPSINAFAMPGGKVGVFSGLIELSESDDELAVVIGHEIAHVQQRHANQRLSAELIRMGLGVAVAYGATRQDQVDPNLVMAAYGLGTQVGVMLPFGRHHEYEADYKGLLIMARAGYDPYAAVTFWEKMEAASDRGSVPEYLSTHPAPGNRIARLKAAIPEALREQEHAEAQAFLRERGLVEE